MFVKADLLLQICFAVCLLCGAAAQPAGMRCQLHDTYHPVYSGFVVSYNDGVCHVIICNLVGAWEYFQFRDDFVCKQYPSILPTNGFCKAGDLDLPVGSFVPTHSDGFECVFSLCTVTQGYSQPHWVEVPMSCGVTSRPSLIGCYASDQNYHPPCTSLSRIEPGLLCDKNGYLRYLNEGEQNCYGTILPTVVKEIGAMHFYYYPLDEAPGVSFEQSVCEAHQSGGSANTPPPPPPGQVTYDIDEIMKHKTTPPPEKELTTIDEGTQDTLSSDVVAVGADTPAGDAGSALSRSKRQRDPEVELRCDVEVEADGSVTARASVVVKDCLSRTSTAQLPSGEQRTLEQLVVGDSVLTLDGDGMPSATQVIGFIHTHRTQTSTMLKISTGDKHVIMTASHHIYIRSDKQTPRITMASEVDIGDYILSSEQTKTVWKQVTNVTLEVDKGFIAPLTASGDMLVNGVLVGCYTQASGSYIATLHTLLFRPVMRTWHALGLPDLTAKDDGLHPVFEFFQHISHKSMFLRPLLHPQVALEAARAVGNSIMA